VRVAQGKPAAGTITVRAFTEASGVVIEVSDDGKGIDPAVIRRKALERGVITEEVADSLDDARSLDLIFEPGFSTAEKVTDVSGRGVGMDVVRSSIRNVHGQVVLDSRPGQGMKVTLRLPLSLMVSRGMVVEAGGSEYLLPLESVIEMVRIREDAVRTFQRQGMVGIRGRLCPLLVLADVFREAGRAAAGSTPDPRRELSVVVLEVHGVRFGAVVDRFVGEAEALVKPLDGRFEGVRLFLGATIMGDGRVLLVVNPVQLREELTAARTEEP
jgi:two-component system chemotaxis sensor kinase CheA